MNDQYAAMLVSEIKNLQAQLELIAQQLAKIAQSQAAK